MTAPTPISETDWQQQVIDLAHLHGWQHLHIRRTIGKGQRWTTSTNVKGWPDLYLWSEDQQRTMAVELKSESGVVTDEQRAVLESLARAGVEVHVWRPSDIDDAQQALARPRRAAA